MPWTSVPMDVTGSTTWNDVCAPAAVAMPRTTTLMMRRKAYVMCPRSRRADDLRWSGLSEATESGFTVIPNETNDLSQKRLVASPSLYREPRCFLIRGDAGPSNTRFHVLGDRITRS